MLRFRHKVGAEIIESDLRIVRNEEFNPAEFPPEQGWSCKAGRGHMLALRLVAGPLLVEALNSFEGFSGLL